MTTTRRTVLTGAAGAAAAVSMPALALTGPKTPPGADAALERLWRQREAHLRKWHKLPREDATDDVFDAMGDELILIERAIISTPADTLRGLAVKARLVRALCVPAPAVDEGCIDALATHDLAREVERMAGGAS